MKYQFNMASSIDHLRSNLIKQISTITDEGALLMLEQELAFLIHDDKDIVDNLKSYQLADLVTIVNEPSNEEVVDEEYYRKSTAKWRLK